MIWTATTRKNVRLVDAKTGEMKCLKCGWVWLANRVAHGRFQRGSWKCPKGCNEE